MGIENLVNSGELQNGQSRAKVAKATRCNDQFYGTYTQASGSARHPERMMIWSALYGNIQLGINPGVGLTNQLEHKGYGALANGYFRHHRTKDAEAITIQGQVSIRYLAGWLGKYIGELTGTEYNEIIIYLDTDSVYSNLDHLVKKYQSKIPEGKTVDFLDKFINEKIQPQINNALESITSYQNSFQNALGAKREAIAQSGIWTGKKKYALHVWDLEGVRYEKPKVKVTGIETQKSSTPEVVREALLDALEILLGGSQEQLRTHVSAFKEKFNQMSIEEIAFPRGVNNVEKYTGSDGMPVKGCPGHVKAAIAFNRLLKKVDDPTLQPIGSGSKIKFVALMEPNPLQSNSFAFEDKLSKSMEIVKKYVDYNQQFETAFINPLKSLATAVGWSLEDVSSLDDFFG